MSSYRSLDALVVGLLVGILVGSAAVEAQPVRPRPSASTPTLVVMLTVDQLRPDYLELFRHQLTGGLARLTRGAVFLNGLQDHAITETAPGHATTLSGRFPKSNGIVANNAGVADPQSPLIGARGEGASPFRFRGTTLVDWLRYANPATRALSVSRKDRGAILPLGRAKQQAYWYASNGTFTTSRYYADTLPSWVQRFNARRRPQGWTGQTWDLLLPPSSYTEPDSVPAESNGVDFVFPHLFPRDSAQTAALFPNYPMVDDLTLSLALEGVSALSLGAGPHTDVLAVSLSGTDAIGHRFGPDSRELHDQIIRLDRYLGAFLDSLFVLRDSTHVLIALTADHGVAPFPTVRSRDPNEGAGHADLSPLVLNLFSSLVAAGVDTNAIGFDEAILLLHPEAIARAKLNADSIARDFAQRAAEVPGVLRADVVKTLAQRDTTRDYVARRWIHMLPPDLPATVVVTLKPYWYWEGVTYATHGSPHDYDAKVPIILWGAAIKPGRYNEAARVVDIAPTLADILGVRPMERLDGRVLRVAVRGQ